MDKKLVFVFVLVALFAVATAKPQGDEPKQGNVDFVNGGEQVDFVDGNQQVHIVDNSPNPTPRDGGGRK